MLKSDFRPMPVKGGTWVIMFHPYNSIVGRLFILDENTTDSEMLWKQFEDCGVKIIKDDCVYYPDRHSKRTVIKDYYYPSFKNKIEVYKAIEDIVEPYVLYRSLI